VVVVVLSLYVDGSARDSDALLLAHCGSAIEGTGEKGLEISQRRIGQTQENGKERIWTESNCKRDSSGMDVDVLMCACSFPELCTRSSDSLYAQLPANLDSNSNNPPTISILSYCLVFIPALSLTVASILLCISHTIHVLVHGYIAHIHNLSLKSLSVCSPGNYIILH
jgi:hypothetical protein